MVQPKDLVENDTSAVYELNEKERQATLELCEQLTGCEERLIDDSDWLSLVRQKSSLLPRRVLTLLREFRNDPGSAGYLLLRNVPVVGDIPLPNTPCIPDSCEQKATISTSAITLITLALSEIISYRAEKRGALVQNVVPVPGCETEQSHAGSVLLELHTENVYHEHFPDFVSLLCVREDLTGVASFCVSSIRHALPLLSIDTVQVLRESRFSSRSPLSFIDVTHLRSHPVLSGDIEDPNLSVDFADTLALDSRAQSALEELHQAFMKTMVYYKLRAGDFVVVDNRITVHGRTSFVPAYDGNDRWLHRVYAHLDNRRTRVDRKNNGPILN